MNDIAASLSGLLNRKKTQQFAVGDDVEALGTPDERALERLAYYSATIRDTAKPQDSDGSELYYFITYNDKTKGSSPKIPPRSSWVVQPAKLLRPASANMPRNKDDITVGQRVSVMVDMEKRGKHNPTPPTSFYDAIITATTVPKRGGAVKISFLHQAVRSELSQLPHVKNEASLSNVYLLDDAYPHLGHISKPTTEQISEIVALYDRYEPDPCQYSILHKASPSAALEPNLSRCAISTTPTTAEATNLQPNESLPTAQKKDVKGDTTKAPTLAPKLAAKLAAKVITSPSPTSEDSDEATATESVKQSPAEGKGKTPAASPQEAPKRPGRKRKAVDSDNEPQTTSTTTSVPPGTTNSEPAAAPPNSKASSSRRRASLIEADKSAPTPMKLLRPITETKASAAQLQPPRHTLFASVKIEYANNEPGVASVLAPLNSTTFVLYGNVDNFASLSHKITAAIQSAVSDVMQSEPSPPSNFS